MPRTQGGAGAAVSKNCLDGNYSEVLSRPQAALSSVAICSHSFLASPKTIEQLS
jgi:hypothetical protein